MTSTDVLYVSICTPLMFLMSRFVLCRCFLCLYVLQRCSLYLCSPQMLFMSLNVLHNCSLCLYMISADVLYGSMCPPLTFFMSLHVLHRCSLRFYMSSTDVLYVLACISCRPHSKLSPWMRLSGTVWGHEDSGLLPVRTWSIISRPTSGPSQRRIVRG